MGMEFWIPLLSALGGALVASITTVATLLIQAKRDDRRHMREVASRLALEDRNAHIELAKQGGPQAILPIAVYFSHHLQILEAAADGKLSAEKFSEISKLDEELRLAVFRRENEIEESAQ
jgi:hypothetical protein